MELTQVISIIAAVGLAWFVADALFGEKPQVININGRNYRIIGVLSDTRVKIRRTFGQWCLDKWNASKRWIRIALACIGVGACGGTEFQLADQTAPDAGVFVKTDAARPTYVDPYVDPTPDARVGSKSDAGVVEASSLTRDASPEADACTPSSWMCGTTVVLPGRFCLNYRDVTDASHEIQQNIPPACNACALSCACLLSAVTCGIYNGGPIAHLAGCVEVQPNQAEVICQQ
jgi:hypothetical protein